ncbi:MAG TPA: kelch repeat-containing protein [Candidatus Krumholzibacteria bacterium]|nr:kelch repeat-containing protein [Candidatus Krumholzibacteria bacterium]
MQSRFCSLPVLLALAVLFVPALATDADAVRDDDGKWSILDVGSTKPPTRKHHTMVYDPVYNRVILYGGETEESNQDVVLNDLWKLDLGGSSPAWTQLTLSNGPETGRHGHSAAYGNGKMYIACGFEDFSGTFALDGWELNLGATPAWGDNFDLPLQQLADACSGYPDHDFEPRAHSAAAYDNAFVIMGGRAEYGLSMHDTWGYDGSAWDWKSGLTFGIPEAGQLNACAPGQPDLRYWHTMVEAAGKLIVFGGVYEETEVSNTFATSDGVSWTALGEVPTGGSHDFTRLFHSAVYDEEGERMVVLGGYTGNGKTGIVSAATALDLPSALDGEWSLLEPCGAGPGAIAEHAAVYDPVGDRMIVFGGVTTSEALRNNDTWVLDFTDGTPPAAATLSGFRGKTTATVNWTAPGDDGSVGTASEYDLRRSTSTITEGNFASATQISTSAPQSAGSGECAEVSGLSACQTYYYALKTRDDACNWSALSNVLSLTQNCSGSEVLCEGGLGPLSAPAVPQMVEYAIRGANPASDVTTLFVGIPSDRQGEAMEISIFDVTGARIRTLTQSAATAGEREFTWDHRANNGAAVAGGVYFARLQLGNETRTHKIVVSTGH